MKQILLLTVVLFTVAACSNLLGQQPAPQQPSPPNNNTIVVGDSSGLYVLLAFLVIGLVAAVWCARRLPPQPSAPSDAVNQLAAVLTHHLAQSRPTVMTADQYRAIEAAAAERARQDLR